MKNICFFPQIYGSASRNGGDKAYSGVMRLGRTTSSQDCDGETLEEKPWDHVTRGQVEAKMAELTGDIFQTPPMVSALKVEGVPLYKLGCNMEPEAALVAYRGMNP